MKNFAFPEKNFVFMKNDEKRYAFFSTPSSPSPIASLPHPFLRNEVPRA
jgi:hypothetical protein